VRRNFAGARDAVRAREARDRMSRTAHPSPPLRIYAVQPAGRRGQRIGYDRSWVLTEADTCRKYVLPKLVDAGWENEPHSISEQTIAVVEAKAAYRLAG
jgi:hypothetical protein